MAIISYHMHAKVLTILQNCYMFFFWDRIGDRDSLDRTLKFAIFYRTLNTPYLRHLYCPMHFILKHLNLNVCQENHNCACAMKCFIIQATILANVIFMFYWRVCQSRACTRDSQSMAPQFSTQMKKMLVRVKWKLYIVKICNVHCIIWTVKL